MRTAEQKVKQQPFTVQFGDKQYPIKVLTMGKASDWRTKFVADMEKMNESFTPPAANATAETIANGFTAAMIQFPEKITELVFDYAPNLDRKVILEECTDEQMSEAFSSIWEVAYPFLSHLGNVLKMVNATTPTKKQ